MQQKIYKSLNHLKYHLNIKEINTNKYSSHNGQACGVMFSNNEQLTVMPNQNGQVVFKSGLELTFKQYRGQIKHYNLQCGANLYRNNDLKSSFLEVCRTVTFEKFLEEHPFVKFIDSLKGDTYINKTAIAQHYELKTPYLDLTSNFDVASFFATCELLNGKYRPYKGKEYGIIYIYDEVIDMAILNSKMEYIGWQPLPRPEQQKASIYKLKENENFAQNRYVKSFIFRHSRSQSKKILNKFDKGRVVFPKDSTKDIAERFKKLTSFTFDEINLAKKRFSEWFVNYEFNSLEDSIKDIEIIDKRDNLKWCDYLECNLNYWEKEYIKTIKKVNSRNYYPIY